MGRGRERLVNCEKCGRKVRRDKAVFIEKPVFTNPLERKDVVDEQYTRMLTREFAYCPSCGKHLRIYEKKIQQNVREKERQQNQFRRGPQGGGGFKRFVKPNYAKIEARQATQTKPAEQVPAQETPVEEAEAPVEGE